VGKIVDEVKTVCPETVDKFLELIGRPRLVVSLQCVSQGGASVWWIWWGTMV